VDGGVTPELQPYQIESGVVNGVEVAVVLCWGAEYTYSSVDGFSAPHPTGIGTRRSSSGISGEDRAKRIKFSSGRFFIVSGLNDEEAKADKCVSTLDGITF